MNFGRTNIQTKAYAKFCVFLFIQEIIGSLHINILKNHYISRAIKKIHWGFPGGAVVENLPANAGDTGSSPGLGRSRMPRSNWAREPQLLSLRV